MGNIKKMELFKPPKFGEVLLSGLESQEKEVFPRKKEKSPF
jgi:hypothetical protein